LYRIRNTAQIDDWAATGEPQETEFDST